MTLEWDSPSTRDLKVAFLNQTKGKAGASRGLREGRAAEDRGGERVLRVTMDNGIIRRTHRKGVPECEAEGVRKA